METMKSIPPAVAALIPAVQLAMTKSNLQEFTDGIQNLEEALKKCPKIHETDTGAEHPAIFHYFTGSTDIFICEYDGVDQMFGFAILGGDLINSEWGYFNLETLTKIEPLNIDYFWEEQSIEAARYKAYPNHYRKPKSLTA